MLKLDHVSKSYTTSTFTQVALDDVSLAFRDNEFVSILGPSGSGKTTMLNVIGGLDHFDSGDLIIDGVSTRRYKDRDWDTYRNNRIGFVFQSYNLIPHQTVLANVELALTLSGVSASERRARARQALVEVGLGDHVDKRPSQLSGGQMQRVAIARALINDPEILLADEPTGALDSRTSVQVMDLLREVASDRLVIMVTHNPELAREYSTRIVELADGRIRSDTDPYTPSFSDMRRAKPVRRTSMSFLTALSLSFNNLMTKKGRTLMTAFAGSIGIIGIAAILSLANGVNAYIKGVEEDTLSVYPLQIMSSGIDMTSMVADVGGGSDDGDADKDEKKTTGSDKVGEMRMVANMFGSVGKNDLASLKAYFDTNGGDIQSYVQDIEYSYAVTPQIFASETLAGVRQVNPDKSFTALGMGGSSSSLLSSSSAFSTNVFDEMPSKLDMVRDQFEVRAGRWPKAYDELVLVLSRSGKISDFVSYAMGLRDHEELEKMVQDLADQKDIEAPTDERTYTLDQIMEKTFTVIPASSFYTYDEQYDVWTNKSDDKSYMRDLIRNGQKLKIVGVMQLKDDVDASLMGQGIYYTPALTNWLMEQAAKAKIVQDQLADRSTNVISGKSFTAEADEDNDDFDMSSLFSIDEEKMTSAFSFDASALNLSALDLSGLASSMDMSSLSKGVDLSSIKMPELDFSSIKMPDFSKIDFDLSDIDLSEVDLAAAGFDADDLQELLTPEVIAAISPDFSSVDVAALLEGIQPVIDQEKLAPVIGEVISGFSAYAAAHPPTEYPIPDDYYANLVSDYLAQDDVMAKMAEGLAGSVSISEEDQQLIAKRLTEQLTAKTPEEVWNSLPDETRELLNNDMRKVVTQLASVLARQAAEKLSGKLGEQLATQLTSVLTQALGTTMQTYLGEVMSKYLTTVMNALGTQLTSALTSSMTQVMGGMAQAMKFDQNKFAEAFQFNMDEKELAELMTTLMGSERTSYDNNLAKLGYADPKSPSQIDIYPNDFDAKAAVISILDDYNERAKSEGEDDKVITYTDFVGALMSSVTDIIDKISAVLIAFVAISLIVSSIMIGVITYISVLERKKEIGILRSIGASKRDISRVFNAETIIEGLVSGLMGVGITALACIPVNIIVEANFDVAQIAQLPLGAALVLMGVSVFLSFVAGLMPARKASKADPVEALRSE